MFVFFDVGYLTNIIGAEGATSFAFAIEAVLGVDDVLRDHVGHYL